MIRRGPPPFRDVRAVTRWVYNDRRAELLRKMGLDEDEDRTGIFHSFLPPDAEPSDEETAVEAAKGAFTPTLYESYVKWMRRAGNYPLRQTDFVLTLEQREEEFGIERAPGQFEIGGERGRGFRRIKEVVFVQETF
jgi:hypothetical protein